MHAQADSAPGKWIESGPHLMLMPKDPASLDAFTDDFHRSELGVANLALTLPLPLTMQART